MTEIVNVLSNFGFPVTIACYLLLRFEKILETNTRVIGELVSRNIELANKIDKQDILITGLKDYISRRNE